MPASPTYKQRGVLVVVRTVRLGSARQEEGGVFRQTPFHRQEQGSLAAEGATLQGARA